MIDDYNLLKKYNQFVRNLNDFFFNTIELVVFKERKRIINSSLIIDLLMKLITNSFTQQIEYAVKKKHDEKNTFFEIKQKYSSLLIQILFKHNREVVENYLNKWFTDQAEQYKNEFNRKTDSFVIFVNDMALFYMNCIYDNLVQENSDKTLVEQIRHVLNLIKETFINSKCSIETTFKDRYFAFNCSYLSYIAIYKYSILIFANLVSKSKEFKRETEKYVNEVKLLFELNQAIKKIVDNSYQTTKTANLFLIKELIRKYGSSSIKDLPVICPLSVESFQEVSLKWIIPNDLAQIDETVSDRFVIIGDKYKKCKTAVISSIGTNSSKDLLELMDKSKGDIFPYLYLAIYQRITLLFRVIEPEKVPVKNFEEFLSRSYPEEKKYWEILLKNDFTHNLKLHLNNSDRNSYLDLSVILVQFNITVLKAEKNLIKPLANLISNPKTMINSFLPTMEEDSLVGIKEALIRGNSRVKDPNVKFYLCPNGHPYILFDVSN